MAVDMFVFESSLWPEDFSASLFLGEGNGSEHTVTGWTARIQTSGGWWGYLLNIYLGYTGY